MPSQGEKHVLLQNKMVKNVVQTKTGKTPSLGHLYTYVPHRREYTWDLCTRAALWEKR